MCLKSTHRAAAGSARFDCRAGRRLRPARSWVPCGRGWSGHEALRPYTAAVSCHLSLAAAAQCQKSHSSCESAERCDVPNAWMVAACCDHAHHLPEVQARRLPWQWKADSSKSKSNASAVSALVKGDNARDGSGSAACRTLTLAWCHGRYKISASAWCNAPERAFAILRKGWICWRLSTSCICSRAVTFRPIQDRHRQRFLADSGCAHFFLRNFRVHPCHP